MSMGFDATEHGRRLQGDQGHSARRSGAVLAARVSLLPPGAGLRRGAGSELCLAFRW